MKPLILFSTLLLFKLSFGLSGEELFIKYNCASCHAPDKRVVGPSHLEISKRYGQSEKSIEKVAKLIIKPRPENWPGMAYMPPYDIPFEEAKALARYILIDSLKDIKKERKNVEEVLDFDMQYH